MANRNSLIAAGVVFILLLSLFFLVRVTFNDAPYLMQTTIPRLNAFVLVHLILIGMMIWFTMLTQMFQYIRWGFVLSFSVALVITSVEIYVGILRSRPANKQFDIKTVEPLELAYLNCYFIVYMYSLISCFLSGLFYCCTRCLIKYRQYKIRKAVKQSIFPTYYSPLLENQECSICLSNLDQEDQLLKIKCGHIFHRECLLEWIRLNQSCPSCRFNVFQVLYANEGLMAALI